MFQTFDRIKELAQKQGLSINLLEEKLGYSRNTIYNLKNSKPSTERISEIADYFNVSTDSYWDAQIIQELQKMVMLLHH